MLKVLFVDDERSALDALRRVLRPHQGDWEMCFVDDPGAAVASCEVFSPDVVVTDLRMPKVDGVSLLAELVKRGSTAVRVVMSGLVSERSFVETLGVANQFLVKPVERSVLESVIQRASELKLWLARPEVRAAVTEVTAIPTLPHVYQQIVESVRRDASLAEIGEIASQDPSITARLLQVANSAYFAPRHPINSVPLAVSFLGLDLVRPLVLFTSLHTNDSNDPSVHQRLEAVWADALHVANLARAIAITERRSRDEVAASFSLGIMHDIGSMQLALRHDAIDFGAADDSGSKAADERERESYGVSHCDVGAHLLSSWGLPDDAVAVAAWHHDARKFTGATATMPPLFVAAAVALRSGIDAGGETIEQSHLKDALEQKRMSERFEIWRELSLASAGSRR